MITDWNAAYDNMGTIAGAASYPPRWAGQAARFRAAWPALQTDLNYGPAPRNRFDLLLPQGAPKGLVVFVHGGFWMRLDKSYWSHLAAGPLAQGWAVGLPSYTLAPEARIAQITQQIARAITAMAEHVAGPIRLVGHSAGGQLVARMRCGDLDLAPASRIDHVISISGLHDLRPLQRADMNQTLRLDDDEARRESPALLVPRPGTRLSCWVGGGELPEFLRQNDLLANVWTGLGAETATHHDGTHNHFTVLEALETPESALTRLVCGTAG